MSFLLGLAASVVEWILAKGFSWLGTIITAWQSKEKSDEALANNQASLQKAEASGDPNAIAQAGTDSLNNTPKS